ncbi:hypothetical protein [Rhodococcus zopfii]|uniref:hypothetical protein n=1 Tax=Rhodococcus zopfii TaxID=43772 RepID=UPI00111130C7|nr:hypothetical protein [Rhodococcus zopfii]
MSTERLDEIQPEQTESSEPSRGALLVHQTPVPGEMAGFELVSQLTEADYQRYKAAFETVFETRHSNMLTYVAVAAEDLVNAAQTIGADFGADPSSRDPESIARIGARLRSKVLTLCATINQHQEQMLAEVERRFGKDSVEWSEVRAEFNQLFDGSFGYRYLYKLRNTMVHYTMMAVSLQLHAGRSGGAVELKLDRSALLDDQRRLNSTQRQELQALTEDPSIFDLAMDALEKMASANPRILTIANPSLHLACSDLLEFDRLFSGRDGRKCLLSGIEISAEGRPSGYRYQAISPEMTAFARRHAEPSSGSTALDTTPRAVAR